MSSPSPETPASVVRLLDASLNRATEGIRVVEDYARFVLNDGCLSRLAKGLRHGIAQAGNALPYDRRLAARDTPGDVGTRVTTPTEADRGDAWHVATASLERVQQALRTLEEYGKTIDPALGANFERLRYDAYTLATGLGGTKRGRDRLDGARLYVLIDGGDTVEAFESTAAQLCRAGADVVQLRDKRLDDRTLVERAKRLVAVCRREGALSIINDRPDIAAIAGADGVHVGQEELSVHDVRTIVGLDALVGVSTHSLEQAEAAVLAGADYLGVGPTFPSQTKSFDTFPGLDLVREIAEQTSLPAFAIGGITAENLPSVLEAGLDRVAVGAAVTGSSDPAAVVEELTAILARSANDRPPAMVAP